MSYIQSAYINALLADASYIDLPIGIISQDQFENTEGTLSRRITPQLARFIADNFEVIDNRYASEYHESGFDAIVWKGREGTPYEGKELNGKDIVGADIDLALSSSARSQIIDMINWWLRETTPATETVTQLVNANVNVPTPIGVPIPLPWSWVTTGSPAQGTGRLTGANSISINGHSLGGHLASAFARILEAASP